MYTSLHLVRGGKSGKEVYVHACVLVYFGKEGRQSQEYAKIREGMIKPLETMV